MVLKNAMSGQERMGEVGMIWVYCKKCKRWQLIYQTTVMRCRYCGDDITMWEGR